MRLRVRVLGLLLGAAASLGASTSTAQDVATSPVRKVLVVYSYSDGQPWQARVKEGIRQSLKVQPDIRVELFEERLDVLRLGDGGRSPAVAAAMASRYNGVPLDAVISEGQDAGDFLQRHPELFPQRPRFILNYAARNPVETPGSGGGHFVSLPADLGPSLALIRSLFPDVRRVVALTDSTPLGRRRQEQLRALSSQLPDNLVIDIWSNFTEHELFPRIQDLGRDTALLYFPVFQDREGRRIEPSELAAKVGKLSPVPVFTRFDILVKSGILGGHVVSAERLGELIVDLASGRLGDVPDAALASRLTGHFFDETQLQRWDISDERLPPGSVILNRQRSVWYEYRWPIGLILFFVGVQSLLVLALVRNIRQRQGALNELRHHQVLLEETVAQRTREYQETAERLDLVLSGADLGLWDFDLQNQCGAVDERFKRQIGWPAEVPDITRPSQVFKFVHPEDIPRVEAAYQALLNNEIRQFSVDFRIRHHDGHSIWIQSRGRVTGRNANGVATRVSGTHLDVTDRKADEANIWKLAFYDPLTHLANRRLLMERLHAAQIASARHQTHAALLFIDLDRFKWLNDTHGHDMGDLLLQQLAQRLTAELRQMDTVARLGGDEFVVLLQDMGATDQDAVRQAIELANKLREVLRQPYTLRQVTAEIDASIGVQTFCGAAIHPEELLRSADQAMYRAKSAGRGQVCSADAGGGGVQN